MADLDIRTVQRRRPRADGWTTARRAVFLGHLAATCNVGQSAAAAGMASGAVWALRLSDEFDRLGMDRLLGSVRLDTRGFAGDVAAMRASLEGPLEAGAAKAGRAIEGSLLRAVRTGSLGFEDLKKVALQSMDAIASAALKAGIAALLGGGQRSGGGGLAQVLGGVVSGSGGGLPGRATGGPVTGGRGYLVGERGPELFVPTAAGRVEATASAAPREVRVAITVNAAAGAAPGMAGAMLERSSRQVARAVRAALAE